jgi:hypothetical protein
MLSNRSSVLDRLAGSSNSVERVTEESQESSIRFSIDLDANGPVVDFLQLIQRQAQEELQQYKQQKALKKSQKLQKLDQNKPSDNGSSANTTETQDNGALNDAEMGEVASSSSESDYSEVYDLVSKPSGRRRGRPPVDDEYDLNDDFIDDSYIVEHEAHELTTHIQGFFAQAGEVKIKEYFANNPAPENQGKKPKKLKPAVELPAQIESVLAKLESEKSQLLQPITLLLEAASTPNPANSTGKAKKINIPRELVKHLLEIQIVYQAYLKGDYAVRSRSGVINQILSRLEKLLPWSAATLSAKMKGEYRKWKFAQVQSKFEEIMARLRRKIEAEVAEYHRIMQGSPLPIKTKGPVKVSKVKPENDEEMSGTSSNNANNNDSNGGSSTVQYNYSYNPRWSLFLEDLRAGSSLNYELFNDGKPKDEELRSKELEKLNKNYCERVANFWPKGFLSWKIIKTQLKKPAKSAENIKGEMNNESKQNYAENSGNSVKADTISSPKLQSPPSKRAALTKSAAELPEDEKPLSEVRQQAQLEALRDIYAQYASLPSSTPKFNEKQSSAAVETASPANSAAKSKRRNSGAQENPSTAAKKIKSGSKKEKISAETPQKLRKNSTGENGASKVKAKKKQTKENSAAAQSNAYSMGQGTPPTANFSVPVYNFTEASQYPPRSTQFCAIPEDPWNDRHFATPNDLAHPSTSS